MATLLLVEDDGDCRAMWESALRRAGFGVVSAGSAEAGLEAAVSRKPDLVVSDVRMPGGGGLRLCDALRRHPRTADAPIVLMSGLSREEHDQLEGFEHGADDYLLKPFSPRYLVAKVQAVLRRCAAPERLEPILRTQGLVLDVAARTATVRGGGAVRLTRKEFDLLTTFLERPGRVLTQRFLLESVWGYDLADYNDTHTVTAHLYSLRRKLGPELGGRIVTVSGTGYRFDPAPAPSRRKA